MLKPEYLNALPEPLVLLMQQLEEWTIRDIARRLASSGVTETARYQWGQLTDFYDETELRAELDRVTGEAQDLAGALYDTSVSEAFNAQQRAYARAGKTAAFDTVRQLLEISRSRLVDDVLNLTGSLGFAVKQNGKIVFQGLGQFYIDALNRAQMEVVTGVSDAQSAIRRAVKEMANSGLRTVDYAGGASMRIDAAARRAVMTGVNQATARMTDRLMEELGAEYVETTAHAGARPDHQVWQGRQFKVNGAEPGYPNFALSTGYGTVTGLCGANCYHSYYPYFPGYSTPAYTREELKHIDPPPVEYEGKRYNAYEATQMQRKYERNIRASRDKLVGYDAAGLSDDFMTESVKLKALERGYRDFSKLTGLPTQNDRLQMLGFDRSVSSKAVWARWKSQNADLPKVIPKPNVRLQQTLEVQTSDVKGVVPRYALLEKVHVLAGKGTSTVLRAAPRLSKAYGGTPWTWEKKTGTIKTKNCVYEIHWYEHMGVQYEQKIKRAKKI